MGAVYKTVWGLISMSSNSANLQLEYVHHVYEILIEKHEMSHDILYLFCYF